jgi:hypothetical protein
VESLISTSQENRSRKIIEISEMVNSLTVSASPLGSSVMYGHTGEAVIGNCQDDG